MEQERDYFGFDEMAQSQKIEVPDSNSTNWSGLGDFFEILAVILSEDPEAPNRLAAAWSMVQGKLQREADVIYDKALPLKDYWSDGPAQKRYFWFAGAEIFALDAWVGGITKKVEILGDLSGEIAERQQEAKDLHRQFKAEYLASIPAGAAKYGFPPDLAKMEKDDQELAAKVAAIYAELLLKYTKKIIAVGQKLSKNFVQGAKWLGGAGVIPPKYVGADAAKPWKPYQPKTLLARDPAKDPGADLARLNNEVPGYPGLTKPPVLPPGQDPALADPTPASYKDRDQPAASAPQPSLTSVAMAGGRAALTPYTSAASPALGIPGAVAGRFTGTSQKPPPSQGVPDLTGVALQGRFGEPPQALPDGGVHTFASRGESILDHSQPVAPALAGPVPAGGMSSSSMAAAMLGMQQQQTLTGRNMPASQPKLFKPEQGSEVSGRKRPSGLSPAETPSGEQPVEPKPDLAREPKHVNRPARPTLADRLAAG